MLTRAFIVGLLSAVASLASTVVEDSKARFVKNEKVMLQANASEQQKFSYVVGAQFGNQFFSIGRQFQTQFDAEYFVLGLRDAGKKHRDSTVTLVLSDDSLNDR